MFTQYKFDPTEISQQAAATAQALALNRPGVNPAQFAAATIAGRLRAQPDSYLQYGPYWWAVKAALRSLGEDFGAQDDADMRAEYGGIFPAYGALVAAEEFRGFYGRTFLAGTSRFDLDADGEESYVLFDSDMEIRKHGGKRPLRVAADLEAIAEPDEVLLDDAGGAPVLDATLTPFKVEFEHEASLWRANVYAGDAEAARSKVGAWVDSGRMGRAIDFSRVAGEATLDSTDHAAPLYVDRAGRTVSEMAPSGALART